jgi:hypothetical protein
MRCCVVPTKFIQNDGKLSDVAITAFTVAKAIEEWIESYNSSGYCPVAAVTLTVDSMRLTIGGICIWNDEDNEIDDLSVAMCLVAYRSYLDDMLNPFLNEEADDGE